MLIYLASPYTDPSDHIRHRRAVEVTDVLARLIRKGYHVFSPVAYCHAISRQFGLPGDYDFWWEFDRKFLVVSDQLWIVTLWGWRESKGIQGEIQIMRSLGKGVFTIEPDTLERRLFPL